MTERAPVDLAPPRKRRVWPWVVLAFVVVLVGAVVALVETVGRGIATAAIQQEVRSALDVPAATPIDVDLGGGSLLLQAVSGRVDLVDIRIDGLALGPLTGDLLIAGRGVPLDREQPVGGLQATYRVPEAALGAIADRLSGAAIQEVALEGSEIVASGEVSLLVATMPLGLGLTPGAVDGQLAFTPTSIRIGDAHFDAAGLAADPFWGGVAAAITQTRSVCIADRLPAALVLTEAAVEGDELAIVLDGSGHALGGGAFRSTGECPA